MSILPMLACALALARTDAVAVRFERIEKNARGVLGVTAVGLETGAVLSYRGRDHFPMQSVYKLPIAMAVMRKVDRGELKLEERVAVRESDIMPAPGHSPIRDAHPRGNVQITLRELLRLAVSESDGTASDVLMRLAGGAVAVDRYVRDLGVRDMAIRTTEKEMSTGEMVQYRNWSTPDAAVQLLKVFVSGKALSNASRDLLLKHMTETKTFSGRIKGKLPSGTVVAHKTGSSGTSRGLTRATNDIGIVTLPSGKHMLIALFLRDSTAGANTRDSTIAEATWTAWQWMESKAAP